MEVLFREKNIYSRLQLEALVTAENGAKAINVANSLTRGTGLNF